MKIPQIDAYIKGLSDWRGELIANIRTIVHEVDPDVTEEWKWEVPVFTHNGMICALGSFDDHIKINFFKGALLPDPYKLFNAGLEAKKTRAIDVYEKDTLNETALKDLLNSALLENTKK